MEIAVHLAVACYVYDGVPFVLSFFPRGVLGEILNLIESVSEGFPSYSLEMKIPDLVKFSLFMKYVTLATADKQKNKQDYLKEKKNYSCNHNELKIHIFSFKSLCFSEEMGSNLRNFSKFFAKIIMQK